jgi:hypothetical protein
MVMKHLTFFMLSCTSYILIHLVCPSVSQSWAQAGTKYGRELGTGGLGTAWVGWAQSNCVRTSRARADWARTGHGHGHGHERIGHELGRAGWARSDYVQTSQVPISVE